MNKNYVSLHGHEWYSNLSSVECIDSPEAWYKRVSELGMKALAISNHGTVLGWFNRYLMAKKYKVKYIHACEVYVSETLEEKQRDNYHMLLIAKNYEGFKEINKLTSMATNRNDNHYYYNPRISVDEMFNTSDNVIVLSACLGGIIWQSHKKENYSLFKRTVEWFIENKHRAFLEVQPHNHHEQISYNSLLKQIAQENDMPLVATGDFHSVSKESEETRMILKKAKKISYEDEDSFKLYLKTYDEMFEQFSEQKIGDNRLWVDEEIEAFLNQTNIIADMVEEFEIDTSIKYPKLYEDSYKRLDNLIYNGIKYRGIDKLPTDEKKAYAKRIKYELDTIKKLDNADYLLLEDDVKAYARENNIKYGYARGSASGSLITYLTQITNINPIKENLSFGRFMNPERVGVADIDTDYSGRDRRVIFDYLLNHPKLDCAHIIAFGTLQLKGAIRDIGRGLDMPLSEVDEIAKNIEDNEGFYRDKYPELFKHVDRVIGCIISMGTHPCGVLVSDHDLDSEIGTFYVIDKETGNPVRATAIDMKEVEIQQWTKLDILGLDSIGIISDTCDLAGISFDDVAPDNIDAYDEKVWESIKENSVGIFQFEGEYAQSLFKDLFSDSTIAKIREKNPNFSYTDLFSLCNAILRPSGASYRDKVVQGIFTDNGHEAINNFLKETLGVLAYQEQQTAFLVEFCDYSEGAADIVRKGIAKKRPEILAVEIPKIELTLKQSLIDNYDMDDEHAESITKSFLQVFIDAANYSFSRNHAVPYSYVGYACAWLRYYYPLEFITASLNINSDKEDKTNRLVEYAKSKNIKINPIKFRYSKAGYMFDKETNSIYQGVSSIKFLNESVAEMLYNLKDKVYNSFIDLLMDIKDNTQITFYKEIETGRFTEDDEGNLLPIIVEEKAFDMNLISFLNNDFTKDELKEIAQMEKKMRGEITSNNIAINSKQIKILINLGYFSEFGGSEKLLRVFEAFEKKYKASHKLKTKHERYKELVALEQSLPDDDITLIEKCEAEYEYLGHIEQVDPKSAKNVVIVTDVVKNYNYTRVKAYQLATGNMLDVKIGKSYVTSIQEMDVIQIQNAEAKPKSVKVDGKWTKSPTEKDLWVKEYKIIRRKG